MGFSELFRPAGKCFASEACPCRGIDNLTAAFARNEYVKSNDLCIISAILIILFETIDTTLSDRLKVKLSAQSVKRPFQGAVNISHCFHPCREIIQNSEKYISNVVLIDNLFSS